MAENGIGNLEIFRSTVEVMLSDGILTREEKRLIIKLASALNLSSADAPQIYEDIQNNRDSEKGNIIDHQEARRIYVRIFEIAIVNASLSKDEFRVLAHLREILQITETEHAEVEKELRELVKEKYDDDDLIETFLSTIKDSSKLVTNLFNTFRKRSNNGERV
ncbi:MAG: hypothetical protein O2866_00500 [archaeon]|nr:hypothetical protein [archaeon]